MAEHTQNTLSDQEKEFNENIRVEYSAIESYHRSLVHFRFIIVGAYLAGASFLAKPALEQETKTVAAVWACLFALLLTVCAWILELRTRVLYRKLAERGEQIEHEYWGYKGANWYSAFWSSQVKSDPPDDEANVPKHPGVDSAPLTLIGKIPEPFSQYISHSTALDLLYTGSAFAWSALLLWRIGRQIF